MWKFDFSTHPQFGPYWRRVEYVRRQPNWVTRIALAAAVLVVVVPLVMLTLAAVLVGVTVFAVLALIAAVASWFSALFSGGNSGGASGGGGETMRWHDDGRRNVRVISRDDAA